MINWQKIPSLSALRVFEAVGRLKNQTEAASELNVTQAAISQQLRLLQNEFGQKLFTRQGKGIALTPFGERLHTPITQGFLEIFEGIEKIQSEMEERPLRISLPPIFAERWLMPRVGDFWHTHPEIELELIPSETHFDLDEVDLAIRHGNGIFSGAFNHGHIPLTGILVASSEYLSKMGKKPLEELDWITYYAQTEHIRLQNALGIKSLPKKLRRLQTTQLIRSAVLAGHGAALLHNEIIEGDIISGRLCVIKLVSHGNPSGYHMLTSLQNPNQRVMTFINWIKSQNLKDVSSRPL